MAGDHRRLATVGGVPAPEDLVGSTLRSVSASWAVEGDRRSPVPTHVWLDLSDAGLVQLLTSGGDVQLVHEEPYPPHDLGAHGRVEVDTDAGTVPAEHFVGHDVTGVRRLDRGWVLEFLTGSVAFADVNDELVVGLWPDAGWAELGIRERPV